MAISKDKKKEISQKLSSALEAKSTVFVQFSGLGVEDNNLLRKSLKQHDADYYVTKKTLLKRSLDETSYPGDKPDLGDSMVALAFGNDALAPAREVFNFSKDHKKKISIIGGIFDGSFRSQEEMLEIATIPDKDTLRGMFANIINSPLQRFAVVLGQVAEKKDA